MEIIYRDQTLAALYKPAGLPALPERHSASPMDVLTWARQHLHPEVRLVHRLDKPTSGILLVTWDAATFSHLYAQFAEHRVEKKYWALVEGEPNFEGAELTAPLAANPPRVDSYAGKPALTIAHTIETFRGYALVACVPVTGRMHQVRLHLAHYGFPVVGDTTYGGRPLYLSAFHPRYKPSHRHPERPLHPETAILLHAGYLAFLHPVQQKKIHIEAALPEYFTIALRQLRRWAARVRP